MKKIVKKLLSVYPQIEFALLFGSYAKGTQRYLSDVDIAIYSETTIGLLEQGIMIATLEEALERRVDLVLLKNLYRDNPKFSFNIISNHQLIFCRNRAIYEDFKAKSLTYYFDMQYTYKLFDEAVKERIANGTFGKAQAS